MKIGRLRHALEIQSYTPTISENGETAKCWTRFALIFGEVRPVSATETIKADKAQQEISHVATIRHRSGVLAKMRVKWLGRTLEILAVIPDRTDSRMMQLTCKEVAS